MKENKRSFLFVALILVQLILSGCVAKTESTPDSDVSSGNTVAIEDTATEESKTNESQSAADVVAADILKKKSDEKSYSRHNGGFFAKNGSILIYVEPENGIYMVDTAANTSKLLVKSNSVQKLYFDGTYVYYMPHYYMGRGIYRVNLEGKAEMISSSSSIQLWVTDDKIYYTDQIGYDKINGTPQGNLCSMNKDGSNVQVLIKNVKNYFAIQDPWIYYTDLNSRALYRAKLDGSGKQMLAKGRTYINTLVDGYVIYKDYNDSEAIHLVNTQTGENTVLGQFGYSLTVNGETYVYTKELDANGVPTQFRWSILQLDAESGKTEKRAVFDLNDVGIDSMFYIFDDWVYFYCTESATHQREVYRTKLSLNTFEDEDFINQYLYFLDGYGYYIEEKIPGQSTGFGRIDLETREITTWPLENSGVNEDTRASSEPSAGDDSTQSTAENNYETKLIFIKKTGDNWLAVDDRGIVHELNTSSVDPYVEPGSILDGLISVKSPGEYHLKLKSSYTSGYVQQVIASNSDAPNLYAKLILDNCKYSSNPEYAVSEYTLKDVKVKKAYNTGRIDAVMTFDVKPSEGAYWWGPNQADGYIRDRQINFTIYGAEGTWQAGTYNISDYFPKGENFPARPQTKYTPVKNQNVFYEDDQFSYFGDKIFLPQTKELKEANTTEYIGTINRINRQTGAVEKLYQGDKNYTYELFCKDANKIYILSHTWEPFSEIHPDYFGVLDSETKEYKKLIDGAVIRAAIEEDKGYLFTDHQLVELDLKKGDTHTICSLPFSANYSYFLPRVNRIMDGKMYFGIFDDAKTVQYVVDLTSGEVKKI